MFESASRNARKTAKDFALTDTHANRERYHVAGL